MDDNYEFKVGDLVICKPGGFYGITNDKRVCRVHSLTSKEYSYDSDYFDVKALHTIDGREDENTGTIYPVEKRYFLLYSGVSEYEVANDEELNLLFG